jgi:hypothetical protein
MATSLLRSAAAGYVPFLIIISDQTHEMWWNSQSAAILEVTS